MRVPRSSLRAFLSTAKSALQTAIANQQRINLVIGNESADLDSVTSSILFAYLRDPSHVPILNISRADIRIRPELLALLPHANIEPSHLITLDDIPVEKLLPENTRWILVDHNVLQGSLGSRYGRRVVGCIDHHDDEQRVPNLADEPRVVKACGSCTSLVLWYCRDAWDVLSAGASYAGAASGQNDISAHGDDVAVRATWDAQVAKLALASILIDTHNLQNESKVTDDDTRAVEYLEVKVRSAPRTGPTFERRAFFKEISDAKLDLGSLRLGDLLRKDYKQWVERGKNIGISTVSKSLKALTQDGKDFETTLQKFAKDRDLALYGIMTAYTSSENEFKRELLLSAVDPSTAEALSRFFEKAEAECKLEPWQGQFMTSDHVNTCAWHQGNLEKSRKQVAPLVREAMRSG